MVSRDWIAITGCVGVGNAIEASSTVKLLLLLLASGSYMLLKKDTMIWCNECVWIGVILVCWKRIDLNVA